MIKIIAMKMQYCYMVNVNGQVRCLPEYIKTNRQVELFFGNGYQVTFVD